MNVLFYASLLEALLLLSAMFVGRTVVRYLVLAVIGTASFVGKIVLFRLNEQLDLIAEKGAEARVLLDLSQYSLAEIGAHSSFAVQAYLNLPAVSMFGESVEIVVLTNAFIGTLVGIIAFAYLSRIWSFRAGLMGCMLFMVYPAAIEFSIVGLRDIVIYFFVSVYLLAALRALLPQVSRLTRWVHSGIAAVALLCVASLREELLPILLLWPGLFFFAWVNNGLRRIRQLSEKFVAALGLAAVLLPVALAVVGGLYANTIGNIGVRDFVTPVELVENQSAARFARAAGKEGGGSHLFTPEEYRKLSISEKVVVQTLGIIIIPMPWLLTDPSRALALVDTAFVVACLIATARGTRKRWLRKRVRLPNQIVISRRMLICFAVGVLMMGVIVSNAGNALRMRVAIAPFIIVPAAVYLAGVRYRALARRHRREAAEVYRRLVGEGVARAYDHE